MSQKRFLAIDIGGTFIKYGIVNQDGQLTELGKKPTPQNLSAFLASLEMIIDSFEGISGIGICCPGKVDSDQGIIYFGGSLPFLHELPLASMLHDKHPIPVSIINDGKAAALAECWQGGLQEINNGAVIILGTGIGGGLIINGEIYNGSHNQAGELSFVPDNSDLQKSDLIGLSGSAVRFIDEHLHTCQATNGKEVFQRIYAGNDPQLLKDFEAYCGKIAFLIISLQATLDIERVCIGGGISHQPILLEELNRSYQNFRRAFPLFDQNMSTVEILPCQLQSNANLIGAIFQLKKTLTHLVV